jgi:homoserine dehydrogenase
MTAEQRVPIVILGLGGVGRALLRQILDTRDVVFSRVGLRLDVVGVADSSAVLLKPGGLPEEILATALEAKANGRSLDALPDSFSRGALLQVVTPDAILADMTASKATDALLMQARDAGSGLVLANKHPLSGSWARAQPLLEYADLRYEATVGAGLPVIATLRGLLDSGDKVKRIEGCMSGTLGFLCSQLERDTSYSTAVTQAGTLGYTEPDPREDLSGRDVARKALILARSAGWPLQVGDVTVEALFPEALAQVSTEEFLETMPSLNESYAEVVQAAASERKVLRYVASVEPEGGKVGLLRVDQDSLMGSLHGPANYFAFHSDRYAQEPLVISGPGAGADVTAAGVLGDCIDLALHRRHGTRHP